MTLVKHELRQGRVAFWVWTAVLAFLLATWIVIIKVDVSVCVIRADLYTCIEKEFICKFSVGENPYGHRIIVMRFCICEIRDRDRIHELYVDVQFF